MFASYFHVALCEVLGYEWHDWRHILDQSGQCRLHRRLAFHIQRGCGFVQSAVQVVDKPRFLVARLDLRCALQHLLHGVSGHTAGDKALLYMPLFHAPGEIDHPQRRRRHPQKSQCHPPVAKQHACGNWMSPAAFTVQFVWQTYSSTFSERANRCTLAFLFSSMATQRRYSLITRLGCLSIFFSILQASLYSARQEHRKRCPCLFG